MYMAQPMAWTLEDLDRLPDDGNKYEVLHGDLFVTPQPTLDHDTAIARLTQLLVPFVVREKLGMVFPGRPAIRTSDSHVEPDLVVRQVSPPKTRWEEAPLPLLVVEVLSQTTEWRDRGLKRDFYVDELRVADYWIVDTEKRLITVMRPGVAHMKVIDRFEWSPQGAGTPLDVKMDDVFGPQTAS